MMEFLGFVEGSFDLDNRTGSVGAAVVMDFPPTVGAAMEATPSGMMTEDVFRWTVNTDFATEDIFLDLARNLMPGRVEETHVDGGKSVSGSCPTFFLPVGQLRWFDLDLARHMNRRTRMKWRQYAGCKGALNRARRPAMSAGELGIVEIPKGRALRSKIDRSARPDFRAVGHGFIEIFIHRDGFAFTIARKGEILTKPCLSQDIPGGRAGMDGNLRVAARGGVCDEYVFHNYW